MCCKELEKKWLNRHFLHCIAMPTAIQCLMMVENPAVNNYSLRSKSHFENHCKKIEARVGLQYLSIVTANHRLLTLLIIINVNFIFKCGTYKSPFINFKKTMLIRIQVR